RDGRYGLGALQGGERRVDAFDDRVEIVATLEDSGDPSAGRLARQLHAGAAHRGEAGGRHLHTAQRMAVVAVEAGGDEDEVGRELPADRQHHLAEGSRVLPVTEPGGERQVDRPAGARLPTHLLCGARAWIVRVLVSRDVEHVRVALE